MNYDDPSEGNKLSGLHRNFAREFRFQKVTNKKKQHPCTIISKANISKECGKVVFLMREMFLFSSNFEFACTV